jgi:hypothetical protein
MLSDGRSSYVCEHAIQTESAEPPSPTASLLTR